MQDKTFQIRIESILGGHSPSTHFATTDQFRSSLAIDPSFPISDTSGDLYGTTASGLLRPVVVTAIGSTAASPLWIIDHPKTNTFSHTLFVYDDAGSVYSIVPVAGGTSIFTELGDLTDEGTSKGNGAAYYDNYIYFARSTTIARYGPLDSQTRTFTDDYWVATLGMTALSNTGYPLSGPGTLLPNHFMLRHSDGKLYIADVVGNQGTIHYIQTTKTTVEGDTNNGSTYNKLQFGYGLYPTVMESYGGNLAIALIEFDNQEFSRNERAKIAFWDTTSQNVNQITWVEFPDRLITAMKNINGILYVVSCNNRANGFRVSRFVGGYTFEQVAYIEAGTAPQPGGIDGDSERLLFGSSSPIPSQFSNGNDIGMLYSLGLQKAGLSKGLFSVARSTEPFQSQIVAVKLAIAEDFGFDTPLLGITRQNGTSSGQILQRTTGYSSSYPHFWWSQTYKIGQPFKITKIRIPLAQAMAAGMIITPKIYVDDGVSSYSNANGLPVINDTLYDGKRNIVLRPENLTGEHNFWLELKWTGTTLCTVGLPITIEYELIND